MYNVGAQRKKRFRSRSASNSSRSESPVRRSAAAAEAVHTPQEASQPESQNRLSEGNDSEETADNHTASVSARRKRKIAISDDDE